MAALMKSTISRTPKIGKMSIILKRVAGFMDCFGCTIYSMSVSSGSMSYLSTSRGVIVVRHLYGKQTCIALLGSCGNICFTTQPAGTAHIVVVPVPGYSLHDTTCWHYYSVYLQRTQPVPHFPVFRVKKIGLVGLCKGSLYRRRPNH